MNIFNWFNGAFPVKENFEARPNSESRDKSITTSQRVSSGENRNVETTMVEPKGQPQAKSDALEMVFSLSIALMLKSMNSKWPERDSMAVAYNEYQELERQGRAKSDYAQRLLSKAGDYPMRIKQAREAHQLLYFMKSVWSQFGSQALIMKPDDFAKVCDKYKLVCGNLSDYLGEIPTLNKAEMEEAKVVFKGYGKDESNPTYVQSEAPDFLSWRGDEQHVFGVGFIPCINNGGWFIAAPKEAFRKQSKPNIDPFVFTVSELGYVLIHSMWGAEAEDATIKRYEQLRDAIIGNSKPLTV